ncbi:sugar phosphate nucleotidyltransferase [Clostridium sp. WILCCON 0269]|uniref:Sugar phosphate nucleotidyltransferase n=1 Tax=Candidatus Clostridium eludens TaxID=3381663 RepID=A0ABW8SLB8_9CLOT
MKAIIMAGGEGTRLRPLTCNIPKPMMPVIGKPIMEYILELLRATGIKDIGATLQYLPDEIINYFGDGKEFGVNISYFIEETPLGTAGSVKNAEAFLNDTFIVISGDALTDIDLSEAIAYHKKKGAVATLVLKEEPVPLEYGVVITDDNGKVTGFLEKPGWGEVFSDKVNTGIYILEPEIFKYYNKNEKFDFSNDLFPILLREKAPMFGYVTNAYWCDIGNIDQYMRCNFDILKGLANVTINAQKYSEDIWIGEDCQISSKAKILKPVYIGSGSKIYTGAQIGPYTVLGKNNIISSDATMKRGILFNNCYIGDKVQIRGAVLCNKVQVEYQCSIFEEAAVGNDTIIKEKATVKPGVKIWPNKIIENSTVVSSNIIWKEKVSKSIFGKHGISGEINIDITPEFVSKLGSAYGSILKADSKVAIACSDNGAAQMFKYSLATGLLSMGMEVLDLKKMPRAFIRQSILFFGAQAGIYVSVNENSGEKVTIIFMDKNGLNIDRNMERKIESSFIREDFRRVKTDNFKHLDHIYNCLEYYIRQLINGLSIENIKNQKYKVVLSINNAMILEIMNEIFKELKIEVKLHYEFNDIDTLVKKVMEESANLGIQIDDECEVPIIVDEKGNVIKDNLYEALNALVMIKSHNLKTLVVPVTASSTLERVAEMCGCKFIRTKTSHKCILEVYLKNIQNISKREMIRAYLMTLDAVSGCVMTINFMANCNRGLSQIISSIPQYYASKKEVECPWNMKGRLMRNLIEESNSKSIDLIEGVKLNFEDGWTLVLPDADEPLCKVYTECTDYKKLNKLTQDILAKITTITKGY